MPSETSISNGPSGRNACPIPNVKPKVRAKAGTSCVRILDFTVTVFRSRDALPGFALEELIWMTASSRARPLHPLELQGLQVGQELLTLGPEAAGLAVVRVDIRVSERRVDLLDPRLQLLDPRLELVLLQAG